MIKDKNKSIKYKVIEKKTKNLIVRRDIAYS